METRSKRTGATTARRLGLLALALAALGACATTGADEAMSPLEHEHAAALETQKAEAEAARFEADAWASAGSCSGSCFGSWSNPTSVHARHAMRHRAAAAKHRRAAKSLRRAEARTGHRGRDASAPTSRSDPSTAGSPAASR